MEKLTFSVIDENDVEHEFEILCAYKRLQTKKHYMIYTDNTYDEQGKLNIYAAIYDPDDETVFEEIQTQEEWDEVNQRIKELRNDND